MSKNDISTTDDIKLLVNSFYDKIRVNENLGYIFDDVAKINWDEHLPTMYKFWGSILLREHSYSGNPMKIHVDLSSEVPLDEKLFNEWLTLFYTTVDEHFEGPVAETAKVRAVNIARNMLYKIQKV